MGGLRPLVVARSSHPDGPGLPCPVGPARLTGGLPHPFPRPSAALRPTGLRGLQTRPIPPTSLPPALPPCGTPARLHVVLPPRHRLEQKARHVRLGSVCLRGRWGGRGAA